MRRLRDGEDDDDLNSEPKRRKAPALASVIVEALKLDSLQRLCSSLEPILRRVVSEEVERALAKLGPARVEGRASPKRIEGPDGRNLQLHFRSRLALPLFTGGKVEGEQGAAIHVVLLDANTGLIVTLGHESSSKLDVVVLEGDFNNEDDDNWTGEEFDSHVVKEREGKGPLLTGELQVSLKEGIGTLGELTFTDNSSWIRSRKFRLGLKVSSGFSEDVRIREAKTEAFMVKDHRGELYKKHYPPSWKDEVWRLEKIGKDGSFHKKLNKNGINTVEDFLRLYVRDPQRLRKILGSGMSNKMWESLIEHAKTCPLSGTYYVYYSDASRNIGAIFNHIFEFSGLIAGGQFCAAESLNDSQKVFADTLLKKAYENWAYVIEYDGKALLSIKQKKKAITAEIEPPALANFPAYDHQVTEQHLSVAAHPDQSSIVTGVISGGEASSTTYNGTQMTNYPQLVGSSLQPNYEAALLTPQNQYGGSFNPAEISRNNNTGLALGSMEHSTSELQVAGQPSQSSNLNSYYEWPHPRITQGVDDFLTEEEIRTRSHQILEHEDMQQLLRNFSMVGGTSNMPDDGFGFSSFTTSPSPFFNFDEDPNRPPGRAVAGWLKIKAAMRWGIFIRKKAAERRRAQLVELED